MTEPLTIWQAILLGVVQGLTEWLPVSSSGHLVLAQALFGIEAPIAFELLVHVGTLAVVLVYFRAVIARMIRATWTLPRDLRAGASMTDALRASPERTLALLVLIGTVPTALAGFLLKDAIEGAFASLTGVGVALVFTGTILWASKYAPATPRALTGKGAFAVGVAQSLALFPGVSRSGSTIATGMLLGVDREKAVEYSFLLGIPAIAGAGLLHALDAGARADFGANVVPFLVGTVAAAIAGYATLVLLVTIVKRRGFHWFAVYCWAVGAGILLAPLLATG